MADFAMKMRQSTNLLVNFVIGDFIYLREKLGHQRGQIRNPADCVVSEENRP
jgi:hypothetical protein